MLSRAADDFLGVLIHFRIVVLFQRIFLLGIDESAADRNCIQLIFAHPAIDHFLMPDLGIEGPFPMLFVNRDWHREIVVANRKNRAIGITRVLFNRVFFLRFG